MLICLPRPFTVIQLATRLCLENVGHHLRSSFTTVILAAHVIKRGVFTDAWLIMLCSCA